MREVLSCLDVNICFIKLLNVLRLDLKKCRIVIKYFVVYDRSYRWMWKVGLYGSRERLEDVR